MSMEEKNNLPVEEVHYTTFGERLREIRDEKGFKVVKTVLSFSQHIQPEIYLDIWMCYHVSCCCSESSACITCYGLNF